MDKLSTLFAPAERATREKVLDDYHYFTTRNLISRALDMVPSVMMILNHERQIVYANHALYKILGARNCERLSGLRPGEALGCLHSDETSGGCGTTEFCRECGAVNAILESQKGQEVVRECRITPKGSAEPLELRVWAIPFANERNEQYTVVAVNDISDQKRREVMERVFFHDLLNTAGGIRGLSELIPETGVNDFDNNIRYIKSAANSLIDEIQAQKQLAAAENGYLATKRTRLSSIKILRDVIILYQKHEVAYDRTLAISDQAQDIGFFSDAALLRRVIGNMVKNALEASKPGDQVKLDCSLLNDDALAFTVNNPGFMPRPVQLQMFQRSFSTKGAGRGIGTYSMKLLGERYLGGRVSFGTSPDNGTTFQIAFPADVIDNATTTRENALETLEATRVEPPENVSYEKGFTSETLSKEKAQALLVAFKDWFIDQGEYLINRQLLSDIDEFGRRLKELARRVNIEPLEKYADSLLKQVETFDVSILPDTLRNFNDIVRRVEELANA